MLEQDGGQEMRIALTAAFVLAISGLATPGSALAQSCVTVGDSTFCNNGVTAQRFGTSTYWSNGLSSHISRQRSGSSYFSNGVTGREFGNTTYFSDGRTCTRVANTTFCN